MALYQQGTTVYSGSPATGYSPVASAPAGKYPALPRTGYSAASAKTSSGTSGGSFSGTSGGTTTTVAEVFNPRSTGQYSSKYKEILGALEGDVNKYIGELQNIAQGDYDFTAKWIEANYKEALGTDDTERANFFKSVANNLEKQVGRIAFDYKTGTYRVEQTKNLALSRLKEDEQTLTRDLTTQRMLEREQQNTNLNARGLMDSGTRENVQGLAQRDIGQLEQDYERQFEALGRSIGRQTEDVNKSALLAQEDLTTTARRGGLDAQQAQQYQTEESQRALAAEKARLEKEKYFAMQSLPNIADAKTLRELGYG